MHKFDSNKITVVKNARDYSVYRYSFDSNMDFLISIKGQKLFDYVVIGSNEEANVLINGQILNSSRHINDELQIKVFNEFVEYVINDTK